MTDENDARRERIIEATRASLYGSLDIELSYNEVCGLEVATDTFDLYNFFDEEGGITESAEGELDEYVIKVTLERKTKEIKKC